MKWLIVNVFLDRSPRILVPDLLAIASEWKPDIVVRDSTEYAGAIIAEMLGLPCASVATVSRPPDRETVASPLEGLRQSFGLDPDPEWRMVSGRLHLCFVPPRFHAVPIPLPETTHFVRHESPRRADETPPSWLQELGRRPTVLAALGTLPNLYNGSGTVLDAIVDGLAGEPVDVIVAGAQDRDRVSSAGPRANVRIERWVPQTLVLPHCDVFVSHGGLNSFKEALSSGVPLVVTPLGADQLYTAQCCAALHLGRAVAPADVSPAEIRAAVHHVLADDGYRASMHELREEMLSLPGLDWVAARLEGLAGEHG